MEGPTIFGIVATALILYGIVVYNSLVSLRNSVKNSRSGIDVQLKRRSSLIPNLVSAVKGYMKHEKTLLENVTKARTQMTKSNEYSKKAAYSDIMSGALKSIFAVAENYPKLKANENFLKLQEELAHLEDQISASRRIYNENVTYMNNKIEMFPSNIVAKMLNFTSEEFFKASSQDKKLVQVEFK